MTQIYDVVGVGFGPSNLALASAIDERRENKAISARFLEQKSSFSWHPNMLLNDTEMQISFLKDIATLRNPSSKYTFLNYLHSKGRLNSFANLKHFYPTRIEYNDYYSWVAHQLSHYVNYGCKVIDIIPYRNQPHSILEIIYENLNNSITTSILAKNIVVATGGTAYIPKNLKIKQNSWRIWHSSTHLNSIKNFGAQNKFYHFCVVGGGQSAAEIIYDLHQRFPNAKVTCVHRGFGLKPADDSEFINELFFPDNINLFYDAPKDIRQKILNNHRDTNYSVVDADLIQKLYRIQYHESVTGLKRLHLKRLSSVEDVDETENGVTIQLINSLVSQNESLQADAMILATGYTYECPPPALQTLNKYFVKNYLNRPVVKRHYQMITTPQIKSGIYIQGYNEATHGLTDTLLSASSIRAEEILDQIYLSTNKQDYYFDHCDHQFIPAYDICQKLC